MGSIKRLLSYSYSNYSMSNFTVTDDYTDDYSYNISNSSAAYYDDEYYYNNCSYYCPSNGLYTISFPFNVSDITNHWYLSGLGYSTRIKMYNYYNHRLVLADCVATIEVQTYGKVLGLSVPSVYTMLVKFPFLACTAIACLVFIVQKTMKMRADHIHNKLYYGPNYKKRLAIKEFITRPNFCTQDTDADADADADAMYSNYDNFMAYKHDKNKAKKKKNKISTKNTDSACPTTTTTLISKG